MCSVLMDILATSVAESLGLPTDSAHNPEGKWKSESHQPEGKWKSESRQNLASQKGKWMT